MDGLLLRLHRKGGEDVATFNGIVTRCEVKCTNCGSTELDLDYLEALDATGMGHLIFTCADCLNVTEVTFIACECNPA